ncbi:SET domain-containing protein-lysine N-methyltransferase [Candidatus Woesearchaeota archaeon]|nr:SET domain-containing protein-lysine N-methyltransferase [Candidatus Woesearchaeota archaeon]USN44688.1 MAG: SET domain-containing protein-lysine N-methyltransferase [Candidatus Woesearchaeota archaeon]
MKKNNEESSFEYIEFHKSPVHGMGGFAKKTIPKGTKIIEYIGDKITKKESDRRSEHVLNAAKENPEKGAVYIFALNKRYDIDGNVQWNPARWLNHSCDGNAQAQNLNGHIWIVAKKTILPGTEITYNYGYDVENWEEHLCRCGAKCCVGHIVAKEQWKKLAKLKAKKKEN